jgi:hypothetical protein
MGIVFNEKSIYKIVHEFSLKCFMKFHDISLYGMILARVGMGKKRRQHPVYLPRKSLLYGYFNTSYM